MGVPAPERLVSHSDVQQAAIAVEESVDRNLCCIRARWDLSGLLAAHLYLASLLV
jgi:hypothetical protein